MSPSSRAPTARRTGRRVRLVDSCARIIIKGGGLAVLAAMCGIMIFLVVSAAPLFAGATITGSGPGGRLDRFETPAVARLVNGADHALLVTAQGELLDVALGLGRVGARLDMADGAEITSIAFEPGRWRVTLGTADGRVLTRVIDGRWSIVPPDAMRAIGPLPPGELRPLDDDARRRALREAMNLSDPIGPGAYVEHAPDGRILLWRPEVSGATEIDLDTGDGAVRLLDSGGVGARRRFLAAVRDDGTALFGVLRSVVRLDGGGTADRITEYQIPLDRQDELPESIYVLSDGMSVIAVWGDGAYTRFDTRDPSGGILPADTGRLVPAGRRATVTQMALGGQTLLVGDDSGGLSAWLVADLSDAGTSDGRRLTRRWTHAIGPSPVVSISPGDRDRTALVALADGRLSMMHLTSEKRFATVRLGATPAVACASPSEEMVVGFGADGTFESWSLRPGHPGVSWMSLFGKVHYEGYGRSEWVYQSTGDGQSEPKYSIVPLAFGTLKATFFAMLFATPLAVLAAVYASEFMHRSIHRVVKPSIELMASLPSVVIGFVAAMVVAPFVRSWLASIMVGMLVVPLFAVTAGMIWQIVPPRHARRLGSRSQLAALALVLLVGVGGSVLAGPAVERALFRPTHRDSLVREGFFEPIPEATLPPVARSPERLNAAQLSALRTDGVYFVEGKPVRPAEGEHPVPDIEGSIERWLDGTFGRAWPGWFVAMMLPAAILVPMAHARLFSRRWVGMLDRLPRTLAGLLELVRLATSVAAVIAAAGAAAWALEHAGLDPRDSIFGRFTQKNTLVVGIVMGFAVIPIIFTLSEDALASVPRALRSASLGAGATPWQTAVRVVLPVAGSGVFSACMIGLGRAVGETMIVLMATGNTPEMELNLFSGFRSLSANIAVEMPEAPRDGTHFRVLFLCGLVLFLMTLIVNTSAEVVRQHFRRRNAAL